MDSESSPGFSFAIPAQRIAFVIGFGGVSSTRFQLDPIGNTSKYASVADARVVRIHLESASGFSFAILAQRFASVTGFGGVSSTRFQLDPIGNT